jgi:prepilin-type N-terminal cleavage/methylation domain-containing protein
LNWRLAAFSKIDMACKTGRFDGFTAIEILIAVVLVALIALLVMAGKLSGEFSDEFERHKHVFPGKVAAMDLTSPHGAFRVLIG